MQYVLQNTLDWPDWRAASARRLNISLLLSTVLVAALLSVLRFPAGQLFSPIMELVVDIVRVEAPEPEMVQVEQTIPEPVPQTEELLVEAEPVLQATDEPLSLIEDVPQEIQATPAIVIRSTIEWEVEKQRAVQDAVDEMERLVSVNPNFDRLRIEAAVKFRASRAPVKKEIWDYVEKDQIGRTILRHGDFYRILDDPSITNRYAFETFQQYMVFWMYRKYVPKELPWVKDILDSHAYLRVREDRRNGIFETE